MAQRGGEQHEHTHHQEPTCWRGTAEKQKEPAIPELRAVPISEEYPSEPTTPWTGVEENSSSLKNINPLTKNVFHLPWETFKDAFSSYRHVYSSSSEGCTKCTPNLGSPRVPPVANGYGAKKLHQSGGE